MYQVIDLAQASELNRTSEGLVMITELPMIRTGKRGNYMVGNFIQNRNIVQFKIWEPDIFEEVQIHGKGIYEAKVVGSEFGGVYLTVKRIMKCNDPEVNPADFLPSLPEGHNQKLYDKVKEKLLKVGASEEIFSLADNLMHAPEIKNRYFEEGAAMHYHDNVIGGLAHHSFKMLNILAAVLENIPALRASADLLVLGIILHDIGKIYEYSNLGPGPYWFSNHRVRGIEFLADHKDEVIAIKNEYFYRQLQAIINGHHGDYADRPSSIAAAIVHYIDTLESQVTGYVENMETLPEGERVRAGDWGFLEPLPIYRETQ